MDANICSFRIFIVYQDKLLSYSIGSTLSQQMKCVCKNYHRINLTSSSSEDDLD